MFAPVLAIACVSGPNLGALKKEVSAISGAPQAVRMSRCNPPPCLADVDGLGQSMRLQTHVNMRENMPAILLQAAVMGCFASMAADLDAIEHVPFSGGSCTSRSEPSAQVVNESLRPVNPTLLREWLTCVLFLSPAFAPAIA